MELNFSYINKHETIENIKERRVMNKTKALKGVYICYQQKSYPNCVYVY
jgi:hypothetical protein